MQEDVGVGYEIAVQVIGFEVCTYACTDIVSQVVLFDNFDNVAAFRSFHEGF